MWHDADVTVEQSILKRKRESHLADALRVLEEELHVLHADLAGAVTEFEALIAETLAQLPDWIDADHDEIRELFRIDLGDQRLTIGPRAAALVAARVETFVRVWVSPGAQDRPDAFDEEAALAWKAEVDDVRGLVSAVADRGREAATWADEALSTTLDALVAQLDEECAEAADPKLDELKRKLRKGKVGTALLTQQTSADLLEEQRRKTEELQLAWAHLEQIAFAGAELGVEASARLDTLLQAAVEAVVGGYPELAEFAGEHVTSTPIRARKFNAPPPVPAADRDGSPSSLIEVDDAHRVSLPIEPTETLEVGRPRRADGSDALEEPRLRYDTEPPRTAQDTPPRPAPTATATIEVSVAVEQFREPAFRVTTAWQHVEHSEVMLALGPPTAYVATLTLLTLAYQVGVWAENPFVAWPQAFPIFFAFAVWAIGFPTFMGWRVEWQGRRPRALRLTDRRQQGFVDVDQVAVSIDDHRFDFAVSEAALSRWQEKGSRGWTLVLADDETEVLFASEAVSARWEDSNSALASAEPDDEWRISEDALLQIADRCA